MGEPFWKKMLQEAANGFGWGCGFMTVLLIVAWVAS